MSSHARVVVLGILFALLVGCAAAGKQVKSAADTQCADSCKNQPADTQGQCIAQCTK